MVLIDLSVHVSSARRSRVDGAARAVPAKSRDVRMLNILMVLLLGLGGEKKNGSKRLFRKKA